MFGAAKSCDKAEPGPWSALARAKPSLPLTTLAAMLFPRVVPGPCQSASYPNTLLFISHLGRHGFLFLPFVPPERAVTMIYTSTLLDSPRLCEKLCLVHLLFDRHIHGQQVPLAHPSRSRRRANIAKAAKVKRATSPSFVGTKRICSRPRYPCFGIAPKTVQFPFAAVPESRFAQFRPRSAHNFPELTIRQNNLCFRSYD